MLHINLNSLLTNMGFRLLLVGAVLIVVHPAQASTATNGWPMNRERAETMQHDQFNLEGEEQFAKWSDKKIVLEARSKGRVELTSDDRDIKSISPGGYLNIKEDQAGVVRSLEVTPGPAGTLRKSFTVRGERREFDAEASAWLGTLLPEIIRHTVIGAEARVQRILSQGGARNVIDEISLVEPGSAKLIYLRYLFKSNLASDDLERVAQLVGRELSSDGDKARILVETRKSFLGTAAERSFFDALNTIKAGGDRRRVLSAVIEKNELSRDSLLLAMESARGFSSDGDKAGFLADAAPHYLANDELASAFFDVVDSIRAGGDHLRVLSSVLARQPVRRENILRAVQSAGRMRADGDKSRFLVEVAQLNLNDQAVTAAVREAAARIGSEGDRMRVLAALSR